MVSEANRSAVIITPTQAFFNMVGDRLNEEPEKESKITVSDSSTVYLLPDDLFDDGEFNAFLKKNYIRIYECEMEGWIINRTLWGKEITWDQFKKFFSITIQSMVYDLVE